MTMLQIPARRTALVAEDHRPFRKGIARLLRQQCGFDRIVEAASLDEAIRSIAQDPSIDLATFDLHVPGMCGASSLLGIRQQRPNLITVVITASERQRDMLCAMAAGVHGYLPKSMDMDMLGEAIEMVLAGRIYLPWSVSRLPTTLADQFDTPSLSIERTNRSLTARQRDVLRLLRSRQSNKQIARELGLTENTVKAHTVALYRALGIRGRDDLALVHGEPN